MCMARRTRRQNLIDSIRSDTTQKFLDIIYQLSLYFDTQHVDTKEGVTIYDFQERYEAFLDELVNYERNNKICCGLVSYINYTRTGEL